MTPGVRKGRTQTVPDVQRGGVQDHPDIVKALLLYGTDRMYPLFPLPPGTKHYTLGSAPDQDIAISSPFISAQHCRLVRIRSRLQVVDRKSKNGTYVEGKRKRSFDLEPGKSFFVGARSHQLLALDDPMCAHYPALTAILGYEDERVVPGETPSPSELIVAAVAGPHLLITSEPDSDQDRLAHVVHAISLLRERPLIRLDHARDEQGVQRDLVQRRAATVLLDLADDHARLPPALTSRLFSTRYQTRVIALARTVGVAKAALGERHVNKMKQIWLEPLSGRSRAIHRLLDMALRERGSALRVAAMTQHNQAALRNHRWPDNFASLREAVDRLLAVAHAGSLRKAALALDVKPNTFQHWYTNIVGLKLPLLARHAP